MMADEEVDEVVGIPTLQILPMDVWCMCLKLLCLKDQMRVRLVSIDLKEIVEGILKKKKMLKLQDSSDIFYKKRLKTILRLRQTGYKVPFDDTTIPARPLTRLELFALVNIMPSLEILQVLVSGKEHKQIMKLLPSLLPNIKHITIIFDGIETSILQDIMKSTLYSTPGNTTVDGHYNVPTAHFLRRLHRRLNEDWTNVESFIIARISKSMTGLASGPTCFYRVSPHRQELLMDYRES